MLRNTLVWQTYKKLVSLENKLHWDWQILKKDKKHKQ
jgi:hypothetical protein